MEAKTLEIRDRMTFIPVVAVLLFSALEADGYLLRRAGFNNHPQTDQVAVIKLQTGEGHVDPYSWDTSRTMFTAHKYIAENFRELAPGDVIDVEFLLGETFTPKRSERFG